MFVCVVMAVVMHVVVVFMFMVPASFLRGRRAEMSPCSMGVRRLVQVAMLPVTFVAPVRARFGHFGGPLFVGMVRPRSIAASGGGGGMESAALKDPVRERDGFDIHDFVQARLGELLVEHVRAFGKGIEKRGGKHVAGHPADGVQVDVHPPDSTPVPGEDGVRVEFPGPLSTPSTGLETSL